jgi:hypothetical protein
VDVLTGIVPTGEVELTDCTFRGAVSCITRVIQVEVFWLVVLRDVDEIRYQRSKMLSTICLRRLKVGFWMSRIIFD